MRYPANLPDVIAVAASDNQDSIFYYSNSGPEVDVACPTGDNYDNGGVVKLYTIDIMGLGGYNSGNPARPDTAGNYTWTMSGTSGACPQVAGLAGLLIVHNPELTAKQIQAVIEFSADGKGISGRDWSWGYGRINAYQALLLSDTYHTEAKGNDGFHKSTFDEKGNLILEGNLTASANSTELTPASSDLMVLKDGNANCVARITSGGDMFIKGTFSERQSSISLSNEVYYFSDGSSNVVCLIDTSGNLKIKGGAFLGADPDRASSQGY